MKQILFLSCLLLHAVNCFSQEPVYYQFTPNNGLPSNEVYHVTTDNQGYLWFGTDRGIARFDGKHFKLYTVNEGLGDNVVDKIFVSPGGKIWARCLNRKIYVLEHNRFVPYKYASQLEKRLTGVETDYVTSIYFHKEQPAYLGTNNSGLLKVTDSIITPIQYSDTVRTLRYHSGMQIVHSHAVYNPYIPKWSFVFQGKVYANRTAVTLKPSVATRSNGDVIICYTHWIFVLRNSKLIDAIEFEAPITNVYEDQKQNLWICFFMQGATRFGPGERITKQGGRTYFADLKITGMVQDFEGGYWFTSYNSGVLYIPDLNIESIKIDSFREREYPRDITGNGMNKLFLATTDRRLAILNEHQVKEVRTVDTNTNMTSVCNDLFYDQKLNKIAIAFSQGIFYTAENDASDVKEAKGTRGIARAGDSLYSIAPYALFIDTGDSVYSIRPDDPRNANYLYCLHAERNPNYVLVGTSVGLMKYAPGKPFTNFLSTEINIRVNAIRKLYNGILVIATLGKGIYLIDGNKVQQVTLGPSVQQNMVNDLATDGNTVWAATEKGVVRLDLSYRKHPKLKSWSVANGFPYNDVRKIHIQQGKVYVIAQNKLISIDEWALTENLSPPKAFLNSILVNDHIELAPDSSFKFSYTHNRIKFSCNGIAFKSGEYLRYKYRLKGLDNKWQIATQPVVEFPSLAPGKYTFELVSLNESNIASLIPVTYSFAIPSPYWKRWWFYLCSFVAIFLLLWFWVKSRFDRKLQHNMDREALLQYEQQALSAQINPHFIFNALNSIQNFILQEDKRNAIKYLSRFSKLMRLNLDNARLKWIPPDKEAALIDTYLELEKLRFKNRFAYKVSLHDHPALQHVLIPSMLIQPFVENAILHGLNNLIDSEGSIEIDLQYADGKLICRIEDNGVGREKAAALKHSHKQTHKGSGVNITRERLQLLCNETGTNYMMEVIDKMDEAGEPHGTIVVFNLPFRRTDNE